MMYFYQEIILHKSPDLSLNVILEKVFMQLHIAFVKAKKFDGSCYALSFPLYSETSLGEKIRILSVSEESFETLKKFLNLTRFADYLYVDKDVKKIIEKEVKGYAQYKRFQIDSSIHQKARRFSSRHEDVSYEQALKIMRRNKSDITLPYVMVKSSSTGQKFSLFIQKNRLDHFVLGSFNSYGLSVSGCVPEF